MPPPLFEIDHLRVSTASQEADGTAAAPVEIIDGLSLCVNAGEVHALLGQGGSGKSTLATTLLGSPDYEVTSGEIRFKGDDVTGWGPDVRGRAGMFLGFQQPPGIAGVTILDFLRHALSARKGTNIGVSEFRMILTEWMDKLDVDPSFMTRRLDEGFSDGEKMRNEMLQMAILEPEIAILDETGAGPDIGTGATVTRGVQAIRAERPDLGILAILAITRYQRLLDHLKPDMVHVLRQGRIVASGGAELAQQLEREGYESFR